MIYIASPYSDPNSDVRHARYIAAMEYAAHLTRNSITAFSPIVYGHSMALHYNLGLSAEYWKHFNNHMLINSTYVHVLKLSGWIESLGVKHEIALAKNLHIPVMYVEPR